MSNTLLTFDVLYNKSKKELGNINIDRVRSRNERAFTSSIENLEEEKENAQDALQALLAVVTKGDIVNIEKVVAAKAKIRKIEEAIADLADVKESFFSKAKTTIGRGRDIKVVDTDSIDNASEQTQA